MATVFDFLSPDQTEVEEQRVIRDSSATVGDVLTVQADKSIAAEPGGGSQPVGVLSRAVLNFVETAGAGIYTAEVEVPAGAIVFDVLLLPVAGPWDADTANLDMGDTQKSSTAYFNNKHIDEIIPNPYDPSNPLSDDNFANLASDGESTPDGYNEAAWGNSSSGVLYASAATITATLTTTGAGGTTGHFRAYVIGFDVPTDTVNAVKS